MIRLIKIDSKINGWKLKVANNKATITGPSGQNEVITKEGYSDKEWVEAFMYRFTELSKDPPLAP